MTSGGVSYLDVAWAAGTHAANIVDLGAAVAQLLQPNANLGLVSAGVNFSQYPNATSLPSIFTTTTIESGTGGWQIVDGLATWVPGGTSNDTEVAEYNVEPTATDYQQIDLIITSDPETNSENWLIGRWDGVISGGEFNNAITLQMVGTSGSRALTCQLATWASALETFIGGNFTIPYTPGATYSLVCGTSAGLRYFQVLINGVPQPIGSGGALYLSDSSSVYGAGYRRTGFAGSQAYTGGNLYIPFPISYWGMADQVLPAGPVVTDYVATQYTSTSTSYADLTTPAQATVDIGSSGQALVSHGGFVAISNTADTAYLSVAVTSGGSVAASNQYAISNGSTDGAQMGSPLLLFSGLPLGANTFTQQAKVTAGTGTYADCTLTVIPR